jgi:hypothetical protein
MRTTVRDGRTTKKASPRNKGHVGLIREA